MSAIPFMVPAEFVAQHGAGLVVRHGAILKDVATGQIVAHMQETGLLGAMVRSPFLSTALNPLGATIGAASSVVANVQAWRIEKRVEELSLLMRGMQGLQYAQIALAGVGLGVSVAGFLAIRKQVGAVSVKLDRLAETVERRFEEQKRRALRDLEGDLEAQLDHAEEGWTGDGTARWGRVANKLNDMVYRYPALIEEELSAPVPDPALLAYLLERYRVLAATRIECLVLIGEMRPAADFAARFAQKTNALLNDVSPAPLARRIARGQAVGKRGDARGGPDEAAPEPLGQARRLVAVIREFQDVSETRPLLLERLIERNIDGRDYVATLRETRDAPAVLLK